MPDPSLPVRFPGAAGAELAGRLHRPPRPRAFALFAHCFTCGKDLAAARRIADTLASRGVGVLRFDFTGLGESGGSFTDTTFSSNVDDLLAAARFLGETEAPPALLVGHSLGGAAVLAAAGSLPSVRAVATIGAPADPQHVAHLFDDARDELAATGEAVVRLAGRPFRIAQGFLDDLAEQRQGARLRALGRALLILHAPGDAVVGIDNARRLYQAARHPKSFVSLDGADHLLSRPADARYAAGLVATWAERYLPEPDADARPGDATVVQLAAARGFAVDIVSAGHGLRADEPRAVGGDDTGPTPYGLLNAALGACTAMTLRMYAERKKWPLEDARITLRHRRVHAEDCADCETKTGSVDVIERSIALIGPLDEAQRARLLEIADRCPVHRSLHGEIVVESRLEDVAPASSAEG